MSTKFINHLCPPVHMKPITALKKRGAALLAAAAMYLPTAGAGLLEVGSPVDSNDGFFTYELLEEATTRPGNQSIRVTARTPYISGDLDFYDYRVMTQLMNDLWSLPANQTEYGTKANMIDSAVKYIPFGDGLAGQDVVDFGWTFPLSNADGSVYATNNGFIEDVTYQRWDADPGLAIGDFFFDNKLLDGNRNGTLGEIGDLQLTVDSSSSLLAQIDGSIQGYDIMGTAPRAEYIAVPEVSTLGLVGLGALAGYVATRRKNRR